MRIFTTLISLTAFAACTDDVLRDGIVLGAVIDQTTAEADTGWTQAMDLAVAQVNGALEAESNLGARFVLRVRDSQGIASAAADEARSLARDEGAVALITDTTDTARAALALVYAGEAALPVQCSSCTSARLTTPSFMSNDAVERDVRRDPGNWLYRTVGDIDSLAVIMGRVATSLGDANRDNLRKASIYAADDSFGREASDAIAAALLAGDVIAVGPGVFVVEQIMHRPGDPNRVDYGRDVSRLLDGSTEAVDGGSSEAVGEPDVIIVASHAANHASFVATYDATASAVPVLHFYRFRQSGSLYRLGGIAQGARGVSFIGTDGAAGDVFAKDFTRAYGFAPPALASTYYDNAVTLMLAALITETEAGTMHNAMGRTSSRSVGAVPVGAGEDGLRSAVFAIAAGMAIDYTGASGPIDYDGEGNVRDRVTVFEVQNNGFVETDVFDCVSEGPCGD
ncbi:MAG: ABC transporter substrate-binding protein [Myxococcota bacterium]